MIVLVTNSSKKGKKYDAFISHNDKMKVISFGARGYEDYTTHHDKDRKYKYIVRHAGEDWDNPFTAGFWAKNLLWNKPTLEESAKDTEDRYGIKIILDS
jgi:hypothetical protein